MQRGIVSAVDGRRARVKRPDGFVTAWMYISDSVAGLETGDIVFYEPFGNDGLILHAIGGAGLAAGDILARLRTVDGSGSGLDADMLDGLHAVAFATAAQGAKADAAFPISGGTLTGNLDIDGHNLTNYVGITNSNGNTFETYPGGLSYSQITVENYEQFTGDDFPLDSGTLLTIKNSAWRTFQIIVRNGTYPDTYIRQYYESQGGFLTWQRVITAPKQLLTGAWSSGQRTLTGFTDYKLFLVKIAGADMTFPAVRSGSTLRGSGSYALSASHHEVSVNHSYSGITLTWEYCNRFSHLEGSNHNNFSSYDGGSCTISEIWGVA